MEKVVITKPMVGVFAMQVCACKGATDEEILSVCNSENPAGTSQGWATVARTTAEGPLFIPGPVQCDDYPDREHLLVLC